MHIILVNIYCFFLKWLWNALAVFALTIIFFLMYFLSHLWKPVVNVLICTRKEKLFSHSWFLRCCTEQLIPKIPQTWDWIHKSFSSAAYRIKSLREEWMYTTEPTYRSKINHFTTYYIHANYISVVVFLTYLLSSPRPSLYHHVDCWYWCSFYEMRVLVLRQM